METSQAFMSSMAGSPARPSVTAYVTAAAYGGAVKAALAQVAPLAGPLHDLAEASGKCDNTIVKQGVYTYSNDPKL